jgi:hypothetical protein
MAASLEGFHSTLMGRETPVEKHWRRHLQIIPPMLKNTWAIAGVIYYCLTIIEILRGIYYFKRHQKSGGKCVFF